MPPMDGVWPPCGHPVLYTVALTQGLMQVKRGQWWSPMAGMMMMRD